ncbi:MAG: 50S ribosomal protein L29 [Candidatus Paceibacteria bacterium]
MEPKELQSKTKEELQTLLSELRNKLRTLKFELAAGKVKNVRLLRKTKQDIARVLTILKAKQNAKTS